MKMNTLLGTALLGFTLTLSQAHASVVSIFVDAAPNKFGSPDYSAWEANAFAAAADGTFVNMSNSLNSDNWGTTNFEIEDEVVYSFGDLGSRLTWVYFISDTTVEELDAADNFAVSLLNTWDGEESDFYMEYYGSTWLEPGSWQNYNGGVIGTAGMAYWGAQDINTQEALDSDIAAWGAAAESWEFRVRFDDDITSLTSNRIASVPEPSGIALLAAAILLLTRRKVR
ncbi:PEP-CTERM sorting domain-containing protein [Alteromonas ponticola]|uniref:PEP-CTERM sorting domain-containing protein n=1 Tax=Alteromonas ponticola TaxID=2720613 RepID=A0ABX1R5K1_9ALTE|nr:PEP-CTERM sorting domain-containing protein [Alteromonas ponticola]NMH60771.1 PEP-CTERM sorting domain-containing protein [Alteromonas ponticola]